MPSAIRSHTPSPARTNITKFTNCRVVKNNNLVYQDIWISSRTGRILDGEEVFFKHKAAPDKVIDLGGRILSPGLIDVQLNGAFGFDFSIAPEDIAQYPKGLLRSNRGLIKTGVTSFTPTVTSQKSDVYRKVRDSKDDHLNHLSHLFSPRFYHILVPPDSDDGLRMEPSHWVPMLRALSSTLK